MLLLINSTALSCPTVLPPANGNIHVTGDASSLTIMYFCNEGYGLLGGDTVRMCTSSNPVYNGTAPTCEGIMTYIIYTPINNTSKHLTHMHI